MDLLPLDFHFTKSKSRGTLAISWIPNDHDLQAASANLKNISNDLDINIAASHVATTGRAGSPYPVLIVDKCPMRGQAETGILQQERTAPHMLGSGHAAPSSVCTSASKAMYTDVDHYSAVDFALTTFSALAGGRADKASVEKPVGKSQEAIGWLSERVGVLFEYSAGAGI
jgi:hypothetical protein